MAKLTFKVWSDGDPDVGIFPLQATVTIEDNYDAHDEQQIENLRELVKQMYEDDEGKVYAQTPEEIDKENEAMEKAAGYGENEP